MKLKRTPDDFQVEERIAPLPPGGRFALYTLTKRTLGTLEAVDAIVRQWNLSRTTVAFAGLKDRHALTRQFLSIDGGPRRGLKQENLQLEHLGQTSRPVHASDIVGNAFEVVVRDLNESNHAAAIARLEAVARDGLPNYFDNQRFGSLGESGEFIARPWCQGDYERAVWLALADPNAHDRPLDRDEKTVLRQHWGDWLTCAGLRIRSWRRAPVEFLAQNPTDFRRALAAAPQHLRSLWLAAFQSHLWNQMLGSLIVEAVASDSLATETIGGKELPFFATLSEDERSRLQRTSLPLPSARLHLEPGPVKSLIDRTMAAEGLELREVRVKYPRDSFFSKGERPALFQPAELTHQTAADEFYPGRQKLTLRFTLPRGSYATILVKRVTGVALDADDTAD
jgi:tRNA pseudouridine13 synthase